VKFSIRLKPTQRSSSKWYCGCKNIHVNYLATSSDNCFISCLPTTSASDKHSSNQEFWNLWQQSSRVFRLVVDSHTSLRTIHGNSKDSGRLAHYNLSFKLEGSTKQTAWSQELINQPFAEILCFGVNNQEIGFEYEIFLSQTHGAPVYLGNRQITSCTRHLKIITHFGQNKSNI
jgi:hypothetical protein